MELLLFGNQKCQCTLKELRQANFDFFKNQNPLTMDNAHVIEMYYKHYYANKDTMPFYHLMPEINTTTNNNQFRFLLVSFDDGELLFFAYKVIQIMTTKQVRFFDMPISLLDNEYRIGLLIDILKEKEFVRFCFGHYAINKMLDFDGKRKERLPEYDNFFFDITHESKDVKYKSHRYLKKIGFESMACNSDVLIVCNKTVRYDDAIELRLSWERANNIHSNADRKEFLRIVKNEQNLPYRFIAIYHKGTLIALRVILLSWNRCAYSIFNIHARVDDKNVEHESIVRHNMTEKMQVLCYNFFSDEYDRIFILGCMPHEKRLLEHKKRVSDGKIEYYIK